MPFILWHFGHVAIFAPVQRFVKNNPESIQGM
jgi:hypothetical protein